MKLPGVQARDRRKIEVVASHLHLYHGMPIVCDVTLVSPLHADGQAKSRAAAAPGGVAIADIEEAKCRKYPELVRSETSKFLILAGEVGGRWSDTTCELLRNLAKEKSQSAPPRLRRSTAFAWENRWWGMLSVAAH